jgi:hypothetical protein
VPVIAAIAFEMHKALSAAAYKKFRTDTIQINNKNESVAFI